jgi:hypothetical protein
MAEETASPKTGVRPPRGVAYLALGLTLAVAFLYLVQALRGRPVEWPSLALLITLFCGSIANFMASPRLRMILALAGVAFAITAIYGFFVVGR